MKRHYLLFFILLGFFAVTQGQTTRDLLTAQRIEAMKRAHSQSSDISINSKGEAISILQNSYLFKMLRNPTDTKGNIDLFVEEMSQAISLDEEQKIKFRTLLSSDDIKQIRDLLDSHYVIYSYDPSIIRFMGINVTHLLKEDLSNSEFNSLSSQLSQDTQTSISAYLYLVKLYKEEQAKNDLIVIGYPDMSVFIEMIFEYFGI